MTKGGASETRCSDGIPVSSSNSRDAVCHGDSVPFAIATKRLPDVAATSAGKPAVLVNNEETGTSMSDVFDHRADCPGAGSNSGSRGVMHSTIVHHPCRKYVAILASGEASVLRRQCLWMVRRVRRVRTPSARKPQRLSSTVCVQCRTLCSHDQKSTSNMSRRTPNSSH